MRETLRSSASRIPLEIHEVPSGTQVLDWTVPEEWNIATRTSLADGERVVDFRASNLHVVGYSEPVRETMTLEDLRPHLHTHPDDRELDPVPDLVLHADLGVLSLSDASSQRLERRDVRGRRRQHARAGLTDLRRVLPARGERRRGAVTTHVCHPSLANDNLSGIALRPSSRPRCAERRGAFPTAFSSSRGRSARSPGSRGTRTSCRESSAGLVVACVGDPAPLTYKRSRRGDALVDRAGAHVVAAHAGRPSSRLRPLGLGRAPVQLSRL